MSAPPAPASTDQDLTRSLQLSIVEGMLWAVMVGLGETYFTAAAVALGASELEIGLVVALPLLCGGLGAMAMLRWLGRLRRRRPLVAGLAAVQANVLLGLAVLAWTQALTPGLLIGSLCLYQVCALSCGVGWSSWYGDLVPVAIRGQYFARRQRCLQVATFAGLLVGGCVLQGLEPSKGAPADRQGLGFALLFTAAGLFRMASAVLLWCSPEPRFAGVPATQRTLRFFATARGRNALVVLISGSLFHAAVYSSAPFFAPLMLDRLGFSWLEYMLVVGAQATGRVLALPLWGKAIDGRGAPTAYALALFAAALIPLPWIWIDSVPAAALAYAWSGLAWGGYELALFAVLLESTVRRTRPFVFSVQYLTNGIGQILGSLAGAGLLRSRGYAVLLAVSFGARLLVAWLLPRRMVEPRRRRERAHKSRQARLVAVRDGADPEQ